MADRSRSEPEKTKRAAPDRGHCTIHRGVNPNERCACLPDILRAGPGESPGPKGKRLGRACAMAGQGRREIKKEDVKEQISGFRGSRCVKRVLPWYYNVGRLCRAA